MAAVGAATKAGHRFVALISIVMRLDNFNSGNAGRLHNYFALNMIKTREKNDAVNAEMFLL